MAFTAITASAFAYCLFLTFFSTLLKNYKKVDKRLNDLAEKEKETGNDELSKPFSDRIIKPFITKLLKSATKLSGQKSSAVLVKLEIELRQAGVFMPAGEFATFKNFVLLFCICIGAAAMFIPGIDVANKLLFLLFALILGILVPRYYLKGRIKKRQNSIRREMPDIMDLLCVSVEAGLGFDAALLRISERSKGALIDELLYVYREIQMGKPRKDAFKSLGERSSVEELKTFTGAMVQAEQLGISIKNVLKLQAQQLRLKRKQTAEEKAMKAPVKMMLPLVAFIFPVLFIILLGPSVIKIIDVLGGR